MSEDGFDAILTHLGTSSWNRLIFAMSALVTATLPANLVGNEFLNPDPVYYCADEFNSTVQHNNNDNCTYHDFYGDEIHTMKCSSWIYDTSVSISTIAMEWNLICERKFLQPLYQTIFNVGCLIGSILSGFVADRFGRRYAVRIGAVMNLLSSIFLGLSPTLEVVFMARFLLGVFNPIMVYPAFLLAMEVCPPRHRSTVGVMLALPCALALIGLSGLAYYIRDWRKLQLISTYPLWILIVLTAVVEESPRWLLSKGRLTEANYIIKKAIKQRGECILCPKIEIQKKMVDLYEKFSADEEERKSWTAIALKPLVLFKGPLRGITLKLTCVWFLESMVYIGIPLSSERFSSPFLYLALMGAVEVPAYSLTAPITQYFGRKKVIVTSFFLSGFCIMMSILSRILLQQDGENVRLAFFIVAFLMICTAYQVNFIHASELLPTTVRPLGTGVLSFVSYIGFGIPPFLLDMIDSRYNWFIAPSVFGCSAIVAGVIVSTLRETKDCSLPETVADVGEKNTSQRNNV